ncbi:MAG TPA: hypothetical protein VEM14_05170 [Gemmatimonadaceae bacterium]|nr:hypothetical protein [Gemmatimonadaceae bacterium]
MTVPWTDTRQVMDTSLDAPNFQCAPKLFTRRDTLTLRAEVPHGGWLTVTQPDGTTFELVAPPMSRDPGTPNYSIMNPEVFANTLILRLRADIRSRPAIYGRDTLEPVFRATGDYKFTIGENLATEFDEQDHQDPNWYCTIRLSGVP